MLFRSLRSDPGRSDRQLLQALPPNALVALQRPVQLGATLRRLGAGEEAARVSWVNHPAEWGALSVLVERVGLAPVLVEQIFQIITDINKQGTTILLVEQNALMALAVAHRGYVLQTGQIVLSDSATALQQNETVQKAYLGAE